MTNSYASTPSDAATLTVLVPPTTFSQHPASPSVCEFESVELCATASNGTPPISYQWQHYVGGTWQNVTGAQSSCYSIPSVDPVDAGQYRCRASNTCGSAYSNTGTLAVKARAKADFLCDDDVDQEDFSHFQLCLTGEAIYVTDPACEDADLDGDNDVDADDFGRFANCFSGVDVLPDLACAD